MRKIKVRAQLLGTHVQAVFWTAKEWNLTFANCGDLVMDVVDWTSLRLILVESPRVRIEEGPNLQAAREFAERWTKY